MDKVIVKNLTYKYPTSEEHVLKDINFSVNEGELFAIIGPNGAGKTTVCNAIRGFIPHFYKGEMEGEILVNGKNTKDYSIGDLSLDVSFVFQNPFTQMSGIAENVYEELAFGLENLGIEINKIKERVNYILELTKIKHLKNKSPYELSGGEQQKVALASIIAMDPEIIVMDEPTSQLDPQSTEEIFKLIYLMKQQGKTIILVEHKMELIAEYAEHILLISDGKVILDGGVKDVFTDELLLENKTALPKYAMLGLEMKKRFDIDKIPITEREVEVVIKNYLRNKEETSS